MRGFLAMGIVFLLGIGTGWAEDEAPTADDREPTDFMPRVLDFVDRMKAYREPPLEEGPGRVLYKAWAADLKTRSKRLESKSKELTRDSWWVMDETTGAATAIQPKHWGAIVRKFGALYTQLGGGLKNYGKVRVSPDHELRLWDKRNPEPRTTGLTPAGHTLLRLRERVRWLRAQGLPIPRHLIREIDRYIILQSEEIELRREAHRRWVDERDRAHKEIRARYAETRVLIEHQREQLAEEMQVLRELMADLQEVEENRLRVLVLVHPEDDPVQASAKKYFKTMVQGRKAAERFDDSRTARYGSLLNQKWTAPRKHLLTAIKKAEKRAAEKEAAEKEAAAPAESAGGAVKGG